MRTISRVLAIPGLAAAALLMGLSLNSCSRDKQPSSIALSTDRADSDKAIPLSRKQLQDAGLTLVRPELISTVERPISGFVEASVGSRAQVAMPVTGQVMQLMVSPGDRVQAGSVVAVIRSPEAAVLRAEADAAQATARSLTEQYKRALPMARQGALAWQELETRRIASVKAMTEARSTAARMRAIGSPNSAGLLQLRSPISGRVAVLNASQGSVLQSGADLAEIINSNGNELRFLVSPLLARNLGDGQLLRVQAGTQNLKAKVVGTAPDTSGNNRVVVVRAIPAEGDLPPLGTAVTAFAVVQSNERRYALPGDAVHMNQDGPRVFRYLRGEAIPVRVQLDHTNADRVEVTQGLKGDELIVNGNTNLLRHVQDISSQP